LKESLRKIVAKRLVIGICGGTGSGKTTITERIISVLSPESVLVLQQDHYYKDIPHLPLEQRARQNFDHPDSFDTPLLIEHVRQLREGHAIDRPVYDFTKHQRASQTVRMNPYPAMILEGILIFENKALRELMDIRSSWTPMPTCASFAGLAGTSAREGGPWSP
jgi:uridine kinase